jgi:hypothetical protein
MPAGRNQHEDFSEDGVNSRYPIYPKILGVARRQRIKKVFKATHQPEEKKDCITVCLKKHEESCVNVRSIIVVQSSRWPRRMLLIRTNMCPVS